MPSPVVVGAIVIAIAGWFATIVAIKNSHLSNTFKRLLVLPSWLPWMALALGAPLMSGILTTTNALHIGGAMTAGMLVSVIVTSQPPRR